MIDDLRFVERTIYKVVTDGKVFRIKNVLFGDENFVGIPEPLNFTSKEQAEEYIHNFLITWREV